MPEYSFTVIGDASASITVEADTEEHAIEQALRYGGYEVLSRDSKKPYEVSLVAEDVQFSNASVFRFVGEGEPDSSYEEDVDFSAQEEAEPWDVMVAETKSLFDRFRRHKAE